MRKEKRRQSSELGLRNAEWKKTECGVRNGKALSRGQMAEARVLNSECGRRKEKKDRVLNSDLGFGIYSISDFGFRISDFGFL
jgi:hypothetical protein